MKQHIQQIEKYLEAHPDRNKRRFQYSIISEITGVDEETAKQICSLQRIIRLRLPAEADKHFRETEAMDEIGYKSKAIHDFSDGRLFNQPIIAP